MKSKNLTLLVVVDNRSKLNELRRVTSAKLSELRILTAVSCVHGLALARAEDPDVILINCNREEDVSSFCQRLKEDSALAAIQVLLLSDQGAGKDCGLMAAEVAVDAFMTWPLDDDELVIQLLAMIKIKQANLKQKAVMEELVASFAERTRALESELAGRRRVEAQMDRMVRQWEATFDATNDAIWILDKDHIIQRSNKTAEKFFPLRRRAMIGQHCWSIVHDNNQLHPECPFERSRLSRQRESMELFDHDRWLRVTVDPIFDGRGRYEGAVHIASDITEAKLAEQALCESERQMTTLLANLPGMVYRCENNLDWHSLYSSDGSLELTGYTPDQLMQNRPAYGSLIVAEDRQAVWDATQEAVNNRQPFEFSYRIRTADGQIKWVWERGRGVFSRAGELLSLEGFVSDITEHKNAEVERVKVDSRFRQLLEKVPIPLCYVKVDGCVDFRNERFLKVIGYTEEEISSLEAWWPRAYPEPQYRQWVLETWSEAVQRAMAEGWDIEEMEYQVTCKSGEVRNFAISGIVLDEGFLATFVDLTERTRATLERQQLIAELERRNAELERFSYTVSHDLKSPLVTILGFIGQLAQDLDAQDWDYIRKDLNFIQDAAYEMHALLESLLQLSRAGRTIGDVQEIALPELAGEVVAQFSSQLETVDLQVEEPGDLPRIQGDPLRLREVLQNLLENAIKFTTGQARPQIKIGYLAHDSEVICFVYDNGIGIPAAYQEKVFGLFEKLDSSCAGTGIGLAIVKRIVEEHGGRVWVESEEEGGGTTFFFSTPTVSSALRAEVNKH